MSILPIRIYPDPILRVRCSAVEQFDSELAGLAKDMVETMYAAPGIGLAASQVGVELRFAVVDVSVGDEKESLHYFVNQTFMPTLWAVWQRAAWDTRHSMSVISARQFFRI